MPNNKSKLLKSVDNMAKMIKAAEGEKKTDTDLKQKIPKLSK